MKAQITKIRNESGDITTDDTEIKKIIREYYEQLFTSKMDNLDETHIPRNTKPTKIESWRNINSE